MDGVRFDDLVRALLGGTSRRGLLRRLSELPLAGGLAAFLLDEGEAKKRKNKKKKRKKQQNKRRQKGKVGVEGPCGDGSGPDNRCEKHHQCCTRHCDKKKRRCRCLKEGQPCTNDRLCCPGRTGRTCQDGICQHQTCAGAGQSCSPTLPCCAGLTCLEGVCQEQACAVAGESCAAGIECCPDLVCVDGACTDLPSTCADTCDGCCAGEACEPGTADNACGIDGESCQACAEPTPVCGAQEPGVCGGCTPITCQSAGAECGTIADGCGGTLPCGSCPAGEVCEDNQCVPPPCGDVCASGCQFSSLQQAIDEAGDGDTLRLCAETYSGTFTITKDLTLLGVGDGVDGTILDGQDSAPLPVVEVGPVEVTLENLRIINGNATSGARSGGGIFSTGTLTLIGCTVSDNSADLAGGGIFIPIGTLTLIGCTVSNNTSNLGGGINFTSTAALTLDGCTVSNNTASQAGGIYNAGTLTLQAGTTVTENHADDDAGGILNDGDRGGGTSTCSGGSSVSGNTPNDCVEVNVGVCGAC